MPLVGYGATLSGTTLGTVTGIKDIRVGGREMNISEVATLGDTNRIPENLPGKVRELPIELTIVYDKTLYESIRDAIGPNVDTFTLSDSESSTHVGLGFVTRVGDLGLDTEGDMVFSAQLTPKTSWTFTAGT